MNDQKRDFAQHIDVKDVDARGNRLIESSDAYENNTVGNDSLEKDQKIDMMQQRLDMLEKALNDKLRQEKKNIGGSTNNPTYFIEDNTIPKPREKLTQSKKVEKRSKSGVGEKAAKLVQKNENINIKPKTGRNDPKLEAEV